MKKSKKKAVKRNFFASKTVKDNSCQMSSFVKQFVQKKRNEFTSVTSCIIYLPTVYFFHS